MIPFTSEIIFLIIWVSLGSTLGFFAFTYTHQYQTIELVRKYLVSIGIGIMISFMLYLLLLEYYKISKPLGIAICGTGAIGLPDILVKYWNKVTNRTIDVIFDRLEDKYDKPIRRHKYEYIEDDSPPPKSFD